ncbi:hypothetical protein FPOAC1_002291 [Fusarium poae]|uniref:hypothetical protein n=1 Tax=Fusarium poae TaxID=36050 RepID=UPI001CEBCFDE|nr:hypothetical protein FPOAC1_002291 [Fusarium poae]KAG8676289.1 hypothetical protein FPOAC1_002291 [Fusarium poae]
MTLPARDDSGVFEEFEIHRRYTNSHLRHYFDFLNRHSSEDRLPGLSDRASKETSKILLLKDISTSAIQELKVLENIIEEIIKKEKPLASLVSPDILSCTVFCLAVAFALPNSPLSVAFKTGTFAGSTFLTIRLIRKYLQRRQLVPLQRVDFICILQDLRLENHPTKVPLQHKVRGLIRAFKNGTIRYRDLDEA